MLILHLSISIVLMSTTLVNVLTKKSGEKGLQGKLRYLVM